MSTGAVYCASRGRTNPERCEAPRVYLFWGGGWGGGPGGYFLDLLWHFLGFPGRSAARRAQQALWKG